MLCLRTSVSMHRLQQRFSIIDKKTNEGIIIKHCVCSLHCLHSIRGLHWAFIAYSKGSPSLTRRPMKVLSLHTVSALFTVYALFREFRECLLPTSKFSLIYNKTNGGIVIICYVCPLLCLHSNWRVQWVFITCSLFGSLLFYIFITNQYMWASSSSRSEIM